MEALPQHGRGQPCLHMRSGSSRLADESHWRPLLCCAPPTPGPTTSARLPVTMRNRMQRDSAVLIAVLAALTLVSCKHAPPAGVVAEVNGVPIKTVDFEKLYATQYPQPMEETNEDQVMAQKLDLLTRLITTEIYWQRAEKLGLTAVDADIDAEINKMKAPYTKEEFEKKLADRHMTVDDLKAQFRRDLKVNKLIAKEITSHINITDADVASFYNANKAAYNSAEPTIHLAQILVTPNPDPNIRNLKNSKAQNAAEAKTKIQDIQHRLQFRRAHHPPGADPGHAQSRPQHSQSEEQQGAKRRRSQNQDPGHPAPPSAG